MHNTDNEDKNLMGLTEEDTTLPNWEDVEEFTTSESLSYNDLYSTLIMNGELIVTIPIHTLYSFKKGIKNVKFRNNAKLRENGLPVDKRPLAFKEIEFIEEEKQQALHKAGLMRLKVFLSTQAIAPVIGKIEVPSNEL